MWNSAFYVSVLDRIVKEISENKTRKKGINDKKIQEKKCSLVNSFYEQLNMNLVFKYDTDFCDHFLHHKSEKSQMAVPNSAVYQNQSFRLYCDCHLSLSTSE